MSREASFRRFCGIWTLHLKSSLPLLRAGANENGRIRLSACQDCSKVWIGSILLRSLSPGGYVSSGRMHKSFYAWNQSGGEWILPAEYYYKSFVLTLPEPAWHIRLNSYGGDDVQGEIRRPFRSETGFSMMNKFTNSSTPPNRLLLSHLSQVQLWIDLF